MSQPSPQHHQPSQDTRKASDFKLDHWTLRFSPEALHPYLQLARMDRPIGTWLLLLPTWWAAALAENALGSGPNWLFYLLFAIGALVMRGAGCVVNDIADRNFDAQVARTALRPIPSGRVSVTQALIFLALLLLIGLAILLQFNWLTIWLGVGSLALVFPYPLMKRITYWPQLWLGLTFNWGAWVGWTASTGEISVTPLLLYIGGIFWTLGYDTIYAHQDKEDDIMIGVKSSALRLGDATPGWLYGFYGLALVFFAASGWSLNLSWPFWLALIAMAGHFVWQVKTLDMNDPENCINRFKSNRDAGLILLAGLLACQWL
ncbi:4-hydroxybenzoate octaprenyltransferase [Rhodovibrionaceae bacterium A322]